MKLIKRFKNRFRRWNAWRKCNLNTWPHKLGVLFGLSNSPTFELFLLPDEYPNQKNMYIGEDMIHKEAFESAKGLSASVFMVDEMETAERN